MDDIAILRGIREAIPNAGDRSPAEVLSYVRDTLRAAEGKPIEPLSVAIPVVADENAGE
jgi:hypothetical protein